MIAVGTGGAYALDKIGSRDIRNGTVRGVDIKDATLRARDVKPDSLGGRQIDETTLGGAGFLTLAGQSDAISCNPASTAIEPCLSATVELTRPARLLVVATGDQYTADGDSDGSKALCQLRIDGGDRSLSADPGDLAPTSHSATATNGFARTLITPDPLPAGSHDVSLACSEFSPDVRIGAPTIAVLAISGS